MAFNKQQTLDRLEKMFWLPNDWDGCGSIPICKKVYDIGKQMIQFIDADVELKIFVGVKTEGSLYCEISRNNSNLDSRIELCVLPDGIIEYTDLVGLDVASKGSLLLSYDRINELMW